MPPDSCAVHVEERLARFEQAWQARPPAPLADFLPDAPGERRRFLHDAIPIDLEYRWCRFSAGGDFLKASDELPSHPLLDDYLRRFPDLGAARDLPPPLIGEEYRVRCWATVPGAARPAHADYCRRFPAQAARLGPILKEIDAELARRPVAAALPVSEASVEAPGDLPPASVGDVVKQLETLPFLDAAQRHELAPLARSAGTDAIDLARRLVERGWLTRFQADFVLRGRGSKLVVGAYVLLDRIGSGWSSQVFRARHVALNRIVALELFRRELLQGMDDAVLRRFYHEMQAVGRLSHPHVVHAYDAGPVGATLFIAMEYLDGIDLHRLVEQSGPLAVEEATAYVYQAALGLQHAFEHGLVHRDIKPSNLMRVGDAKSTLKVLDLGMARIHQAVQGGSGSALTRTGWLMGTADFMAPEQGFDPHGVDIRADLYSLGCTYFYLLTGRPPFPGGTFLQKLNRHREMAAPAVTSLRPDVPAELTAVIGRLLSKRPEERGASPGELAAALAAATPSVRGNRSTKSGVTPAVARSTPSLSTRWALWLAAGVFAFILFAGIAVAGWLVLRTKDSGSAAANPRPSPEKSPKAPRGPFRAFEGAWVIHYTNGATRIYLIDPAGRVYFTEGGRVFEGTLRADGDEILLAFPGDEIRLERVAIKGDRILIDHFNPASGYPSRPLCTGDGERKHSLAGIERKARTGWDGIWIVRYANNTERAFAIDEHGEVWVADGGELRKAQVPARSNQVTVHFGTREVEQLRLQGSKLQVQRFEPAAEEPGKASLTGIGQRR